MLSTDGLYDKLIQVGCRSSWT